MRDLVFLTPVGGHDEAKDIQGISTRLDSRGCGKAIRVRHPRQANVAWNPRRVVCARQRLWMGWGNPSLGAHLYNRRVHSEYSSLQRFGVRPPVTDWLLAKEAKRAVTISFAEIQTGGSTLPTFGFS